ncbi:MAG: DNA alkylation repair protein [Pyrinomonadaceae bacterium]
MADKQYGVSCASLAKLQKKIKTDHDLARQLWSSGVHDARVLATMIADPEKMTNKEIDLWAKDLSNYVLTDAFAGVVAKASSAQKKAEQWTKSTDEWIGSAGWQVLGRIASQDKLPDSYFEPYLATIQKTIHASKNRVRHAMNSALIAIGVRNTRLQAKALGVAGKIGKVEVDHGDTSCQTPDAAEYIAKTLKRREQLRTKTAKA